MVQKIVIRADASIQIGLGHIMRCLALADELKKHDAIVHFICRDFPGQMISLIKQHGHQATLLPPLTKDHNSVAGDSVHVNWLGVPWQQDAKDTIMAFGSTTIDWLIVDHYGISNQWHKELRHYAKKIMVIDDLADRELDCDLLLDQTYGRDNDAYNNYVPGGCKILLGCKYALLRPEFSVLRSKSLKKRKFYDGIKCILISMGGADPDNLTGAVLDGLTSIHFAQKPLINVVLGKQASHLSSVIDQAKNHHLKINVLSDVSNMAELMIEADLAIGASGTTSWERCALGLPSLITVLADNQKLIATMLENLGAVKIWSTIRGLQINVEAIHKSRTQWNIMQTKASSICDANGCERVTRELVGNVVC